MKRGALAGAIAGAVGTLTLDIVSYVDMFVQGRAPSSLPGDAAASVAGMVGIDLSGDDDASKNRRSALGAILGYSTGILVGAAYGVVRRRPGSSRAGIRLGASVMAIANGPMVAQGLTDPREWGAVGWISDIVPHMAYGIVTARTYEAITA
ncbi:MAG: hypothetical protein QOC92_1010 [Acidimicrobiaceae bacterium]|jgi:hypothetical protein